MTCQPKVFHGCFIRSFSSNQSTNPHTNNFCSATVPHNKAKQGRSLDKNSLLISYLGNLLLVLLGLHIRSNKELGKEVEEGKNVHNIGGSDTTVAVFATRGQKVSSLGHHGHKLDQLQHGQRRFPPNGKGFSSLGVFGVHADEIISVHDRVDEAVEGDGEVNISVIKDIGIQPVEKENGKMVVDVQKGKLSPLFAKHNEDGIPEIPSLGNIEHPQQIGDWGILGVKSIARHQRVSVSVGQQTTFNCHVSTEHDLRHVVEKFDWVGVHGGNTGLHDGGTNENKGKVGQSDGESGGKIRQEPSLFLIENYPKLTKDKKLRIPAIFNKLRSSITIRYSLYLAHLSESAEFVFRIGPC